MLKNIWEIENNPIFSSGGPSINDEENMSLSPTAGYQRVLPNNNNMNGAPGYYSKGAPLNIVQEEFKESKLQMEGIGNAEVYFVDD